MNINHENPYGPYNPPASRAYVALIIIGIIILIAGGIIYTCIGFLDTPESPEYNSSNYEEYQELQEKYEKDMKEYSNNRRIISTIGNIVQYIGAIFLSIGLIIGAVKDESLAQNARLGMLIAMGLIIAFKIGGFFAMYTS